MRGFRAHCKNEQGFTMLEALFAISLSLAAISYVATQFRQTLELKQLTQKYDIITEIEAKVRRAVNDFQSFAVTTDRNPALAACMSPDPSKKCSPGMNDLTLFLASGGSRDLSEGANVIKRVTGRFDAEGNTCSIPGCPIELQTRFFVHCQDPGTCKTVLAVNVAYDILLVPQFSKKSETNKVATVRSGLVSKYFAGNDSNDSNSGCGVDRLRRPMFAWKLNMPPRAPDCSALPEVNRRLVNVNSGRCTSKTLLAGFKPDGGLICVPIRFSE